MLCIICFNVAFCYTGLWLPPEVNSLLAFWPQQSQTIYLPGQRCQLQQQRRLWPQNNVLSNNNLSIAWVNVGTTTAAVAARVAAVAAVTAAAAA